MRLQRTLIVLLVAVLAAGVLTACDVRVAGRRCTVGSPLAQDATHVLQCRNGRWTRVATKQEVALRLAAAFHSMPTGVDVGDGHACATMLDRSVRCWGSNASGQLGDGTTTSRSTPVDVANLKIESSSSTSPSRPGTVGPGIIALGDRYSCGVSPSQAGLGLSSYTSVHCWGDISSNGSTRTTALDVTGGDGVRSWLFGPTGYCIDHEFNPYENCSTAELRMPEFTPATAGRAHECYLQRDADVVCLGANDQGQLGDGTTTAIPFSSSAETPLAKPGLVAPRDLQAGGDATCAVTQDLSAVCWGANEHGQVGDGTTVDRSRPTKVSGLSQVLLLAVGRDHACATAETGPLWCWGANTNGQLGDGSTTDRSTPIVVPGLTNVTRIAAGAGATCALGDRGADKQRLYCWGRNDWGQVGDGTTTERHEPTLVKF